MWILSSEHNIKQLIKMHTWHGHWFIWTIYRKNPLQENGRIEKKFSNCRAGSRRNESSMLSLYDAILRNFRKDWISKRNLTHVIKLIIYLPWLKSYWLFTNSNELLWLFVAISNIMYCVVSACGAFLFIEAKPIVEFILNFIKNRNVIITYSGS